MTVLSVSSFTPANGATEIDHCRSIRADFEALNTAELESLYDDDAAFATGSVSGTKITGDHVELDPATSVEDFSGYTVDTNISANGWTYGTTAGSVMVRDRETPTNRLLERTITNSVTAATMDSLGASEDSGIVSGSIYWNGASGGTLVGPCFNVTGSLSSLRGYHVTFEVGTNVHLYRFTGDGTRTWVASATIGTALTRNAWYKFLVRFVTTAGTTVVSFKVWAAVDSEPASWTSLGSSTIHPGPGAIGVCIVGAASGPSTWVDDFGFAVEPAVYPSSGTWTSPNIDVSGVGRYSTSRITWDETTPANTTVTVEVRLNSGSWVAATNGGQIPNFTYDDDMTGADIDVRVTLETTDTSVTPELADLRLYFDPCNFEDLTIEVDGQDATVADGTLACWGKQQVSGGVPVEAWDALVAQTDRIWWFGTIGATITIRLKYNGATIDTATFSTPLVTWGESVGPYCEWRMDAQPFECGPNLAEWACVSQEVHSRQDAEWLIIDMGLGIHADAKYYIGHQQRDLHPMSLLVAELERGIHPMSLLVNGYRRDLFPAELLVQGTRRDFTPFSVLVGEEHRQLFPMAYLCGELSRDLFPAAMLIYAVNRNNAIEVHVISQETYDALTGAGITPS